MSGYTYRGNRRPPAATFDNVIDLASQAPVDPDEALLEMPDLYDHGKFSNRGGKCRRGCCWNPFAVCYYGRRCRCHPPVVEAETPHLAEVVPFPTFDMLDNDDLEATA